jgi:hypothetical protein
MIAPVLFVFVAILGGAMRPGYSHISDTVSELFSPGSPNKLLLDILHTTFALLLVLFGVGILRFVRRIKRVERMGMIGAFLFIAMGCVTVLTASIFPQDPWGTAPTFAGQMHIRLGGVVGLLSIGAMLLMGIWLRRTGILPWFALYSLITVGAVMLATGYFMANTGSPIMGLAERITILIGFQWTFVLALSLFSRTVKEAD